ncbi:MAG: DUF4192 domain-containing protein [Nocardioidaceae bacterium]
MSRSRRTQRRQPTRSKPTTGRIADSGRSVQHPPRRSHGGSQAILKASSPGDVIALIPYQLGFQPERSLVLLVVNEPRGRLGPILRVDLPDRQTQRATADYLVRVLSHHGLRRVIAVAFSPQAAEADTFVEELTAALTVADIELVDAWRADGRRWYSYVCTSPVCCPSEGVAYGQQEGTVVAEAVVAGAVALPDRQALRDSIDRLPDPGGAMLAATASATLAWSHRPTADRERRAWLGREMDRIVDLVTTFSQDKRHLDDTACARLSVAVQDIMVRDAAWAVMDHPRIEAHVDLWTQVTRRAVDGFVAAPSSLLGFACWIQGSGALARCAAERALRDDPGYSMAHLLEESLDRCVPPSAWRPIPLQEIYAVAGCQPGRRAG